MEVHAAAAPMTTGATLAGNVCGRIPFNQIAIPIPPWSRDGWISPASDRCDPYAPAAMAGGMERKSLSAA